MRGVSEIHPALGVQEVRNSQQGRRRSAAPHASPSAPPHGPQDASTAYSEGGSSSRPVLERPSARQPRRRSHSVEASESHDGQRC